MTIDEAIKVKEEYRREHFYGFDPRFVEADDLSIEALKVYQKSQAAGWYPPGYKLPGESEE